MEEGSLYSVIKKHKILTEVEVSQKMGEICQAIKMLHSLEILHRDIKPENIVISHVQLILSILGCVETL